LLLIQVNGGGHHHLSIRGHAKQQTVFSLLLLLRSFVALSS
jgi:hypothetical protein